VAVGRKRSGCGRFPEDKGDFGLAGIASLGAEAIPVVEPAGDETATWASLVSQEGLKDQRRATA
jgi:hypothetical protein